jgi:hypothetical protein
MHAVMLALGALLTVALLAPEHSESASVGVDVPLSPRNANYSMEVWLDPDEHRLRGAQTLTWTNPTSKSTRELRYHLYYNAWRNSESSWFRHGRGRDDDLSQLDPIDWAYTDVETLELVDEAGNVLADLAPRMRFIAPDDGNEDDRTVLRVVLPNAVGPAETIRVRLTWESRVPRTFARTGVRGDYYFLAQWFPKVGVFEPDGTWACHQFIQTEFYADFGEYDVRLHVPTGWVVGATGRRIERTDDGDGRTMHRFVQADVHDFAWTTDPDYEVFEQRFEPQGLPAVDMRLLLRPEHDDLKQRYFDATAAAIEHYGSWWGPYPYGHVTIVDPGFRSGSGGMEYPTLFTGGARWLSPRLSRRPEGVTVHEMGHQYWYGIIANDEFEHAWLDEGFNTYSTSRTLGEAFPEVAHVERYFDGFLPVTFEEIVPQPRYAAADRYRGMQSALKRDPQATPSWRTGPGAYRANAYGKGALTLRTLEKQLGWHEFQKGMASYFEAHAFGHPEPQDFFDAMERSSGVELDEFFDQVWRQSVVFDYAVGEVRSERVGAPRGWGDGEDGSVFARDEDGARDRWRTVVHVRRWGEGIHPIFVDVEFEDGTRKVESWDGKARWTRFEYFTDSRLRRVRVDPEQVLSLDIDSTNDSWLRRDPSPTAAAKWSSRWMIWTQATLESFAFFG